MAFFLVGVGSSANDGTGDALRTAFETINDNFAAINSGTQPGKFTELTATGAATFSAGAKFNVGGSALDFFEQGVWTPEVADAVTGGNVATLTNAEGAYVRIGNMVWISFRCRNIGTTGLTAGNTLYVRNLPFACGPNIEHRGYFQPQVGSITFTGQLNGVTSAGASNIIFADLTSGAPLAVLTVAAVTATNALIAGSTTYLIGD